MMLIFQCLILLSISNLKNIPLNSLPKNRKDQSDLWKVEKNMVGIKMMMILICRQPYRKMMLLLVLSLNFRRKNLPRLWIWKVRNKNILKDCIEVIRSQSGTVLSLNLHQSKTLKILMIFSEYKNSLKN